MFMGTQMRIIMLEVTFIYNFINLLICFCNYNTLSYFYLITLEYIVSHSVYIPQDNQNIMTRHRLGNIQYNMFTNEICW